MEVKKKVKISLDNPSIQRINEKCINCGVCYNTCSLKVGIDHDLETSTPSCINCGMCIQSCPTGALVCKYNYKKVLNLVKDTSKRLAVSCAPAVRASLAEDLGLENGYDLEPLLPTIMRKIGFTYVFDVTFGADVTVMEEATELLLRLKKSISLPMFTSCCPAWVKYAGMYHSEILPNLSTTKSPISIQSTLIKTYFKELSNIEDDIISVVIAPCTAKKYEATYSDTDYLLTTRELAYMIKECNIDIYSLKPTPFDSLLSRGSHSGCIFGRSGGVMEAVLSTAQYLTTGVSPKQGTYHISVQKDIERRSFKIGSHIINVAVVSGLRALEELLKDTNDLDMVEVMNCPGGCVGGGGNPLGPKNEEKDRLAFRTAALNNQDNDIIYSHCNKEVEYLYDFYLTNEKIHELLHTTHKDLSSLVKPKEDK